MESGCERKSLGFRSQHGAPGKPLNASPSCHLSIGFSAHSINLGRSPSSGLLCGSLGVGGAESVEPVFASDLGATGMNLVAGVIFLHSVLKVIMALPEAVLTCLRLFLRVAAKERHIHAGNHREVSGRPVARVRIVGRPPEGKRRAPEG
jgi:hypothetical protein